MNTVLEIIAKILEMTATITSDSTSIFVAYQPKRPDCMKIESETK